ncbi:protein transport protein sec31-like [Andrographis paniculata]|uniref:protein transport protein sec31-like n=1 Tax=Andrographis paniculata TaxID=175694 RepID=UPI0021E71D0C|nr:protein transport protein sec31-like [Andrographis paniculata]
MRVLKWTPDFKTSEEPPHVPVWVTLPLLPLHMYHRDLLFTVAAGIGTPLKVDTPTATRSRCSHARVCVEIDLTKPLLHAFEIDVGTGVLEQKVIYERLPSFCSLCRHLGHKAEACLHRPSSQPVPVTISAAQDPPAAPSGRHDSVHGPYEISAAPASGDIMESRPPTARRRRRRRNRNRGTPSTGITNASGSLQAPPQLLRRDPQPSTRRPSDDIPELNGSRRLRSGVRVTFGEIQVAPNPSQTPEKSLQLTPAHLSGPAEAHRPHAPPRVTFAHSRGDASAMLLTSGVRVTFGDFLAPSETSPARPLAGQTTAEPPIDSPASPLDDCRLSPTPATPATASALGLLPQPLLATQVPSSPLPLLADDMQVPPEPVSPPPAQSLAIWGLPSGHGLDKGKAVLLSEPPASPIRDRRDLSVDTCLSATGSPSSDTQRDEDSALQATFAEDSDGDSPLIKDGQPPLLDSLSLSPRGTTDFHSGDLPADAITGTELLPESGPNPPLLRTSSEPLPVVALSTESHPSRGVCVLNQALNLRLSADLWRQCQMTGHRLCRRPSLDRSPAASPVSK